MTSSPMPRTAARSRWPCSVPDAAVSAAFARSTVVGPGWNDQPVLVTPIPGTDASRLLEVFRERLQELLTVRGSTSTGPDVQIGYLRWATTTAGMLRSYIGVQDIQRLLPVEGIWQLAGITPEAWNRDILTRMPGLEVDNSVARLTEARDELEAEINRWRSSPGRLLVTDTSLFIHHPQKLDEMVLADDLQERHTPLRLIVPMVVVDELDQLKQSGKTDVRGRARLTLAILDRVLRTTVGPARLRDADYRGIDEGSIPRGEVTVEVLLDPAGRLRLPINDDEIVDRALAVQTTSGRSVTLITYDTGHAMRARNAGLSAVKLTQPGPAG